LTIVAGTGASPESGRADFARLRAERRHRLLGAMAAQGVDVAVLGRPASVLFASGARQLWTAGARPFGPACVVVGATGRVHLLSTWDEGVPPEIGHDDLFGLSWNPTVIASRLAAIPGLAGAVRIATDGFSPGAGQLLRALCPAATLVDGGPLLDSVRVPKSDDELACIVTAVAVAEAALVAMAEAAEPGVTERQLVGVYLATIASLGAPTPPTEAVAAMIEPRSEPVSGSRHRPATDRPLGPGELVVLSPGAFHAGYEGTLGRTTVVGGRVGVAASAAQQALADRCGRRLGGLVAACRAGASGADLERAWAGTAGSSGFFVRGVGLGAEPPVIAPGIGRSAVLETGCVLLVEAWVAGVVQADLVLVRDGGPELLTRLGSGPLVYG
jgi:Xaa-Pro aminopeptidase